VSDPSGPIDLFRAEASSSEAFTGTISRITFRSDETGYTVARATRDGDETPTTLVGRVPPLAVGERVRVRGQWIDHPRFGRQLQIDSIERVLPRTRDAIARYLGSGLVPGIGPKLAERIVEAFGDETLDVIDQRPRDLAQVRGISPAKAAQVVEAVRSNAHQRELMLLLEEAGLGARSASRILEAYGTSALRVVREDPFRLARDIWGIGFARADALARRLGFAPEDERRVEAGVLATLARSSDGGDVYAPKSELARRAAELLGLDLAVVEMGVGRVCAGEGAVLEADRVYPRALHRAEVGASSRVRALFEGTSPRDALDFDEAGAEALQRGAGIRLSEDQLHAIRQAHESRILVLTGGPGTGKTTLTRFLLDLLAPHGLRIALAAPTGRAARRLAEATGRDASTLHRLLGFDPQTGGFGRDEDSPVEADLVLVDESSMVDLRLFDHLLGALSPGTRLILVGDANQLPSVGPGDVLRDLVRSGMVPVSELRRVYRQGERSLIVENAHRILSGESPQFSIDGGEFVFLERNRPDEIADEVRRVVRDVLPGREGVDPIRDVQVLVPMHKGEAGADALNTALQEDLNSRSAEVRIGSRAFRPGDRVIQLRNDYRRNVFNGEIGLVESVSAEEGSMQVKFDSIVALPSADWDQVALAYAITVHKSQGSEYEWVVIPLSTQHAILLDRSLFYTAVTRARKGVVLVGQARALALALRPRRSRARRTTLAERMRDELDRVVVED
jgi:exodeoxyribonuclease V alpha subunit